jgi:GNAT superfamily N-acetyltransferase
MWTDGDRSSSPVPEGAGAGTLVVTVTYVEMVARPEPARAVPAPAGTEVVRIEAPTVSFYRYLYGTVGRPWLWYERREMSDAALHRTITAPGVEIHVLYVGGVPAGYAELDRANPASVEIAYFGLVPEYIGHGLGPYLLDRALTRAWEPASGPAPERVWLHTCTLDHPKALQTYQRAGFEAYDRCTVVIDDPRRRMLFD